MFPIMVIGSHDFPAFSGWKPCFSADHKQFLARIIDRLLF
jgi:hypothetical protein